MPQDISQALRDSSIAMRFGTAAIYKGTDGFSMGAWKCFAVDRTVDAAQSVRAEMHGSEIGSTEIDGDAALRVVLVKMDVPGDEIIK